ncbi:MAG: hypothetical protein EBY17_31060, partial [Acidobacteriia bacterium]|nr:hypothetical protein [Terriglobia bacterium]
IQEQQERTQEPQRVALPEGKGRMPVQPLKGRWLQVEEMEFDLFSTMADSPQKPATMVGVWRKEEDAWSGRQVELKGPMDHRQALMEQWYHAIKARLGGVLKCWPVRVLKQASHPDRFFLLHLRPAGKESEHNVVAKYLLRSWLGGTVNWRLVAQRLHISDMRQWWRQHSAWWLGLFEEWQQADLSAFASRSELQAHMARVVGILKSA